ncbi:IPT/TIG domain-containing protein [Sporosarcina sp. GW1-11]|uniref:IPT/TIG domain-containing protein n=1 Tax=Sporosarcina sp. GW1-11 TaxID=2899126 RepID=UPI00294D492B|nr:IPT/TIG domain-containing protein [Sporosarcina sp. GW1-11]MDV6376986.1 IPT/TIG domain-containing protein [Sporosarcina sp. GW1-11]
MNFLKTLKLFLIAILIIGIITPNSTKAAIIKATDLVSINKTISKNSLVPNEVIDVTLTIKGTPQDVSSVKPNDVILIIDKSGSMSADNRMNAAKVAAKEFIDLMDLTKHKVGIVDFDTNAYSFPLTDDKNAAKNYVDTIQLGGTTNTGDAVRLATSMLKNKRPEAQPTIVIMSDGAANSTPDALAASRTAKDAGITFYSIALLGPNDSTDSAPNILLKGMSTSSETHYFVLGSIGLSDVYKKIVEQIGLASAYNVTITDTISSEFELVKGSYKDHIPQPTVSGNTIQWFISELKTKELSFTYQVRSKSDAAIGKYPVAQTYTTFEAGNGLKYTLDSQNPMVEIKNHGPIITNISEEKGPVTGGENVTITGSNFLPNTKVYFGNSLAPIISESATEIVVTTPPSARGTITVKVENTDRQFALGEYYYYAEPTIKYLSPAEGPFEGGNRVLIFGSNFMKDSEVYIDNTLAESTFGTGQRLSVIVPQAKVSGAVNVKIVNPDSTEIEVHDSYTYLPPLPPVEVEVNSVSVNSSQLTGGIITYVSGKNFEHGAKVFFGEHEAPSVSWMNSSKIKVTVPSAESAGFTDIKVVNPDNKEGILSDGFEYLAPPEKPKVELHKLGSDSGVIEGGELLYLFGKNIDRNAKVFFGSNEVPIYNFVNISKIRVRVPAATIPGLVSVKIENPDGSFAELQDSYEYMPPPTPPKPEIDRLSLTDLLVGETSTLYLFGKNISPLAKVFFGDIEANSVIVTASKVRIIVPTATLPEKIDVKVLNPDGQEAILVDGFEYKELIKDPAPRALTFSQQSGSMAGGETMTITGENFKSNTKVFFGTRAATVISASDTVLEIKTAPSTTIGSATIKIVNPDGQEHVEVDAYNYEDLKATITRMSLSSGPINGSTTVYIYGTNFNKNLTVTVGDIEVPYDFLGATRIRIKTPKANMAETVKISVERSGFKDSRDYTYN